MLKLSAFVVGTYSAFEISIKEIFACGSGGLPIPFGEYSNKSAIEHLYG